jgi:hypothetical protein
MRGWAAKQKKPTRIARPTLTLTFFMLRMPAARARPARFQARFLALAQGWQSKQSRSTLTASPKRCGALMDTVVDSKASLKTPAYAAQKPTAALAPWSIERREPGPHDVLIDILYCSVCHSDIH